MAFSKEFIRRAEMARRPVLSPEVWSNAAADLVRIAAFAGFDVKEVIIRCFKSSRGTKVNIRTVQSVMMAITSEKRNR